MSKVRDLPQKTTLAEDDIFYVVDFAAGVNGGRKIKKSDLKTGVLPTPAETKALYEANANTNAFTDAEKTKLAGIEPGATADQNAAEVPYDNSDSFLQSTNVKEALDELNGLLLENFSARVDTGHIVRYSSGTVHVDGTIFQIPSGAILVAPNITDGYLYVDRDGVIKQTGSGVLAPPGTYPFARFSSDSSQVIALTDIRAKINQNIIRGDSADISEITPNAVATGGGTHKVADAGHTHAIATAAAVGLSASTINTEGTSSSFARSDHTHAIPSAAPVTQSPDQANGVGTSTNFARADHVHNIPTAAAVGLSGATANAQGSSSNFSRADHTHAIATGIVSGQAPDQANAAGTSANLARADHIHNIPTAAAVGLGATSTNTQGSGAFFARADHTHALATGAASTQTPDQANATGTSANLARADHIHNIPTAVPVNTGTANAQGSASTFARSDHIHNTIIANQEATETGDVTTTSTSDTLLTGMTLTPSAGTYLVIFSASTVNSGNGAERNFFSIYSGASQVSGTERSVGISGGAYSPVLTHSVVSVNGSQAIEVRWRVAAGTGTARQRKLTLIRLG